MSARPKSVRLFVAVYPPAEVTLEMARVAAEVAEALGPYRATPTEQVHLTMQFIGDTAPRKVDDVVESVERAASGLGPTTLAPLRLIALPNPERARLLAAETDAPPVICELRRRLASRLARRPRRDGADRFLPHLTLLRFRPERTAPTLGTELNVPSFLVDEIKLMRSTLRSDGAQHEPVAVVPL